MSDGAPAGEDPNTWPPLPLEEWEPTRATLHMWTQVVGKIRLTLTPLTNHWWNVPLYLSARGLTTSVIPYGARTFEIEFDFLAHRLDITTGDGQRESLPLAPCAVADFYGEVMGALARLGIDVKIWTTPVEVPDPVPFTEDRVHSSYDPAQAERFWRVLSQADRVLKEFRARFSGKCSAVHFFWGSFDLAVTRFSGRRAPEREGADPVTREAYSHEVISHGFWPGSVGTAVDYPAFYSYTAPEPAGLRGATVQPPLAFYSAELSEFILPYEAVQRAASPDEAVLEFLQSTYEAGADLAGWDRDSLERKSRTR